MHRSPAEDPRTGPWRGRAAVTHYALTFYALTVAAGVAGAGCAGARLRVPARLPDSPRAWPFASGMTVVQLRLDVLARRVAGTPLADRSLAHQLVGRVAGLRRLLESCRVTPETRLTRVFLALPPFDRLLEGAVVAIQGEIDAPAVVRCAAGVSAKLVLRPVALGPYPAMKGHLGKRAVLVTAIARDTVVLAVGAQVDEVPALLAGRTEPLSAERLARHLGPGAAGAALTVTIERFLESRVSMFTSALLFATRLLRAGWLQASLGEGGGLRLEGDLETRGPIAALRLHLRWKILTAILGGLDPDAKRLLGALQTAQHRRFIRFHSATGAPEREAFGRLVDRLLKRLAKRSKKPKPGPAGAPTGTGAAAPPSPGRPAPGGG